MALALLVVAPLFAGIAPYPVGLLARFGPWDALPEARALASTPVDYLDLLVELLTPDALIRRNFEAGRFPLWNPYIFLGTPLMADGKLPVFSPFTLLGWLVPVHAAWALNYALQIIVACIGMGLFLRGRGLTPWAAAFGATAFTLSGFMLCYLPFFSYTGPLVWLPLWMWTLDRWVESRRRSRWAQLALISAAAMLSGNMQAVAMGVGIALAWSFFVARDTRGYALVGKVYGPVFLALGAAMVVTAIHWLPGIEFAGFSGRGRGVIGGFYADSNFIPPDALLALAVPALFGHAPDGSSPAAALFHRDYWSQLSGLGYAGISTLVLALVALRQWKPRLRGDILRTAAGLCAVIPLLVLLFLGTPPGAVVRGRTLLVSNTDLLRLYFLTGMGLAVLGAIGVHHLAQPGHADSGRRRTLLVVTAGLAGIAGIVIGLWSQIPSRAALLDGVSWKLMIPLAVLVGVCAIARRGPLTRARSIGLLVLLLVELAAVGWEHLPWMRYGRREPPPLALGAALPLPLDLRPDTSPARTRIAAEDTMLFPNLGEMYGYEDIRGYESLAPARTQLALGNMDQRYFAGQHNTFPNLFFTPHYAPPMRLMGVGTFINKDGRMTSHEAVPRATLVPAWRDATPYEALTHLIAADTEPLATTWVENLKPRSQPCTEPALPTLDVTNYDPHGGAVIVASECGGILRVTDVMAPGWRAFVSSSGEAQVVTRETRIHYTDYLFRGVRLDPGVYTVRFRYQPWAFRVGLWATLASATSALALMPWMRRRPLTP